MLWQINNTLWYGMFFHFCQRYCSHGCCSVVFVTWSRLMFRKSRAVKCSVVKAVSEKVPLLQNRRIIAPRTDFDATLKVPNLNHRKSWWMFLSSYYSRRQYTVESFSLLRVWYKSILKDHIFTSQSIMWTTLFFCFWIFLDFILFWPKGSEMLVNSLFLWSSFVTLNQN